MGTKNEGDGLITVKGVDPAALESLIGGARRNKLAMTRKQIYDSQRIRVRTQLPEVVRDLLREVAGELSTSVNDVASYLLIYALALYYEEDEALHELLDFASSRSPKKEIEIKIEKVMERLQNAVRNAVQNAAEGPASAEDDRPDGADDGADEWGGWLDQSAHRNGPIQWGEWEHVGFYGYRLSWDGFRISGGNLTRGGLWRAWYGSGASG